MRHEQGFTLVEALIAFAILAVTLVALYGVFGTSAAALARTARLEQAVLLAQSKLDELDVVRAAPAALEGPFEGTGYSWRIELLPEQTPEPPELAVSPLRTQRLKLMVAWMENGRRREIAVEKIILVERQPGT